MGPGRRFLAAVVVSVAAAGSFALSARATVPATWCGDGALQSPTDRMPDLAAGLEVHVIYAHPSDGPDRISTFGDAIAGDAASIDAWWRGQDSSRTVRFDMFGFAGCSGFGRLDISDVTLPHDSTYFAPHLAGVSRYEKLATDLSGAFSSSWKKYIVYYDGPVDGSSTNICGESTVAFGTGGTFSMVYLQACSSLMASAGGRAHVVAHELVHSLGASPTTAKNDCGGANTGHVCDNPLDIVYWIANPATTIDTDILDFNHDDYYGTGAQQDVRKSSWLTQLDVGQLASTITLTGSGTVLSDKPGIECPDECSNTWDKGTQFTLTAAPAAGSRFAGWSGGVCSGTDASCPVTMDAAKNITATFVKQVQLTISVDASKASGTVVSDPAGISCPGTCTATFDGGQTVQLVAQPGSGSRLEGWGGSCSGAAGCSLVPDGTNTVSATFGRANRALSVSVAGKGKVISTPAGIACPGRCSGSFAAASSVALKAVPAKGYVLASWSGACRGKRACRVSLNNDTSVRATFKKR
ncbi:MAG: InlB B-repeat-containing protein [Gaiellaceae bacterium]